jgi:phosphoenolpyruvate-protein phosphotransferase (PTS system enzyme I)
MSLAIHGLAVSRGVAIGRAVVVASSRANVAHYFIQATQVAAEIARVGQARDVVVQEIERVQRDMPADAPSELHAILDVHLMLLQDVSLEDGVKHWIADRHYNAEWALRAQLEVLARQFDEMDDEYLRERKSDLEQVVERLLRALQAGAQQGLLHELTARRTLDERPHDPNEVLILVAHELSPADMLQFKHSLFEGFVTDVGGRTSHTAIVARSMDIPAVVGARNASQLLRENDLIIIDGDAGVVIVDPSPALLTDYRQRQQHAAQARALLDGLRHTPAITRDGKGVHLLANIEQPEDTASALAAGAVGVGLFRSEFLFMGRHGQVPSEEEQYQAYALAVKGMQGLPLTIRTVDVGADKPLDGGRQSNDKRHHDEQTHLNPALGLRAIRWCLAEPEMFVSQLKAILRAASLGPVQLLIPMLTNGSEIRQSLMLVERARAALRTMNVPQGLIKLGAMIEVPAAAIHVHFFLKHFDFLSIGTNDLIQYTLAIDRADQAVAHLYDPLHPAILRLLADTIGLANAAGKGVTVCGEMAGDTRLTPVLLGLGLRSFSMHPAQLPAVKQMILQSDTAQCESLAKALLASDEPSALLDASLR